MDPMSDHPTPPPPPPTLPPGADGPVAPRRRTIAEILADAGCEPDPPRPVLHERPEGCICDFAHTGAHRFSCLRQGQVVLALHGSPAGGLRVEDSAENRARLAAAAGAKPGPR